MGIEIVDVADVQRMEKGSYECAATRGNVKDCEIKSWEKIRMIQIKSLNMYIKFAYRCGCSDSGG